VPPRYWTAWPLSAEDVPRSGEQVGPWVEDDLYTLKRREIERPSRELEDILMGLTLRLAKERFQSRKSGMTSDTATGNILQGSYESTKIDSTDSARLSERADSQNEMELDEEDLDNQDGDDAGSGSGVDSVRTDTTKIQKRNFNVTVGTSESSWDNQSGTTRPTVSADDERSREILRPTIRHFLSRLDELLMALHHSRKACLFRSEQRGSQTELEDENQNQSNQETKGPLSHPSLRVPSPLRKIPDPSEDALGDPLEPRRSSRGRKNNPRNLLDGEPGHGTMAQTDELQPGASRSSSITASKSTLPAKQRKPSRTRGNTLGASLGLRDWSEVIGVAAMIGFSPEIIRRTARRCANIFGEGIDMRFLVESAHPGEDDELKRYIPEQIPSLDNTYANYLAGGNSSLRTSSARRRRRQRSSRPQSETGETEEDKLSIRSEATGLSSEHLCPHIECVRHKQGFTRRRDLRIHLKRVHRQTEDEVARLLKESDEEMEGAVHVDWFLKHVRRRVGWRGSDGVPRKRKRTSGKPRSRPQGRDRKDSESEDGAGDSDDSY
jgi:hypothetical protein